MMPFIVVLGIQMYNTKMRSWKLINRSNAQKKMAKFGFGCDCHNLNNLSLNLFLNYLNSL